MSDANRLLFLRIALIVSLGLGLGTATFALSNDDHWSLRDAGRVFAHRRKQSRRSQEPHLVHVWSSVVHAAIMGVQALSDPAERGHLVGDVPALILVAIILAVLMPRGLQKVESGPHTVPA